MKKDYQNYDAVQMATDEAFIRWVKNPVPEVDAAWESWLEQHPHKRAEVEEARVLVKSVHFQPAKPPVDTERLWQRIQADKEAPVAVKPLGGRRRFLFGIAGAAAAAIALLVFVIFGIDRPNRVRTPYGEQLAVSLPDQSEVRLNAGSTLEYDDSGRRIKLDGEAFFAVEKGSTFLVETDLGQVAVLGTKFNVFSREDRFSVHCTEGRVQVTTPTDPEGVILTPGMASTLDENGRLLTENLSGLDAEVAWLQDLYRFDNQPLRVVFAEMERQFGVDIEAGQDILSINHVGSFEGTDLDSALFQVCYPHNLQSTTSGKKVSITHAVTE
jgi:ferric-dicitrate binding protein FerR (iron transport regulator)